MRCKAKSLCISNEICICTVFVVAIFTVQYNLCHSPGRLAFIQLSFLFSFSFPLPSWLLSCSPRWSAGLAFAHHPACGRSPSGFSGFSRHTCFPSAHSLAVFKDPLEPQFFARLLLPPPWCEMPCSKGGWGLFSGTFKPAKINASNHSTEPWSRSSPARKR